MSYYLLDFDKDKDIEDFDINNLLVDSKIEINKENFMYPIFYVKDEAKELFIKLPKIRVLYDWDNLKYNNLKIKISPKYDKTDKCVKMIKKIEDQIAKHKYFNRKKVELEMSSIIHKECDAYYIKTYYQDDKTKITSDNKITKINEFKKNGEIQMVIKLSHIWKKNNKIGLSSKLYQIKYFAPPDVETNFIDFIDDEPPIKYIPRIHVVSMVPKNEEIIPQQIPVNIKPQQPVRPSFMLNPAMLQSVKLKKVEINKED